MGNPQSYAVVPDSIQQRHGLTEDLHQEFYDTPLCGVAQVMAQETECFTTNRNGNTFLTNLPGVGFLTNNRQFNLCGLYVYTEFCDPTAGFALEPAWYMYDLFCTFTYMILKLGPTEKMQIPMSRIPSGGGIYGYNSAAAGMAMTSGVPTFQNIFWLQNPIFIGLGQDFKAVIKWAQGVPGMTAGGAAIPAIDPLTAFNLNTAASKVIKVGLVGVVGQPPIN